MGGGELERVARQAAAGDSAALSRLVEEMQHPVYRLALRFLGHPEDAKDATQEALVRVITHLGQFEGRSQFMTFAYTIAMRQLMRTRRRELESAVKGAEEFAAALDQGLADRDFTAEEAEYRLLSAEVRISCTYAMLVCLSRPLRASYILGDAMGMPDVIAAEICGISPAAQRQRLARARRTTRAIIAKRCGLVVAANPAAAPARSRAGSTPESSTATTWSSRHIPDRQRPDRDGHDPARRRAARPRPGDERGLPLGPELRRAACRMGARQGRLPGPLRMTWPPRCHPRTCSASFVRSTRQ
jgi:RNA polymerase sigma factor (sigma-70 family)